MPEQVSRVVVRFAGDSGDGMQLTGGRFGAESARQGNDIVTLPDFPAEIRAPQGSIGGVSSFQVHFADRDIVTRCVAAGGSPGEMTVGDVMTAGVVTVSPFVPSGEAARKMADAQIRRLPVCNNGELVGMISLGDLARSRDCGMEAAAALSEISGNIPRK